jgi:hypothetical protein
MYDEPRRPEAGSFISSSLLPCCCDIVAAVKEAHQQQLPVTFVLVLNCTFLATAVVATNIMICRLIPGSNIYLVAFTAVLVLTLSQGILALDNIVDTVMGFADTFGEGLQATGLDSSLLSAVGPFTVFAPTNEAFQIDIPPELLGELLDSGEMTNILRNHIVVGLVTSDLLTDGSTLSTVGGLELNFEVLQDGTKTVNGIVISQENLAASNGVIHVIDRVLKEVVISPTSSPIATSSPTSSKSPPTFVLFPTKSPISDPECNDSSLDFVIPINGKIRSCDFVGEIPSKIPDRCRRASVRKHCPDTCGLCPDCHDSPMSFMLKNGKKKSCKWVKRKPLRVATRCKLKGVKDTCRVTCGAC